MTPGRVGGYPLPSMDIDPVQPEMNDPIPPTVQWLSGAIGLLDQRLLPEQVSFFQVDSVEGLCEAIDQLVVRGAPALAVAGALGIALARCRGEDICDAARRILSTRPTAVNLRRGVERASAAEDPVSEALAMIEEDVELNRRIGAAGASLLETESKVLTHCNAGSLACAGYGTALGVIRAAHVEGRRPSVWVTETRPVMQGSRLSAWELKQLGIPATVVTDSAAGTLMAQGRVDCVVVGADRIAANGDVANKIGTYTLAVLAHNHDIPFYVAAPVSTVDLDCGNGSEIPIERRPAQEMTFVGANRIVPEGVEVYNPAFDITPSRLVSAIVTEKGVLRPPYTEALVTFVGS